MSFFNRKKVVKTFEYFKIQPRCFSSYPYSYSLFWPLNNYKYKQTVHTVYKINNTNTKVNTKQDKQEITKQT